tara:strand:- start:15 stop:1742 length:1728 start_codon:yes stop_codon:yes gene_type:complete
MTQSQFIQRLKLQPRMGISWQDTMAAINTQLNSFLGAGGQFAKTFLEANAAIAAGITTNTAYLTGLEKQVAVNELLTGQLNTLIDRSLLFEKRNSSLNKSFGLSSGGAANLSQELAKVAKFTGLNTEQTIKYATSIKKIVPTLNVMTKANTKSYQGMLAVQKVLTTNVGLTDEAAEGFAYYAGQTGKNAVIQLKTTQGIADAIDEATGMQGSFKDITEEISKASAATQLQFGRMPGNLEMAAIKGKALGFTLDQMTGIGTKMLDIESSIGSELEYQLLSGNRLVNTQGQSLTNKFREAALSGDANKQADALNTILEQEGKTLNNNVLARQQMAKLLGIEEGQLARALQKKKILEEMGADKKLFELGGDELKKALQAQVDAGKITAAQMKNVVKISDTRTTDQRIDESNKYLEDIRMFTFLSTKQATQIMANSADAIAAQKKLNTTLIDFESPDAKANQKLMDQAIKTGQAQIVYDQAQNVKAQGTNASTVKATVPTSTEKQDFMIRSSGEVVEFTSQDDVLGAKKGGPIDKALNGSNGGRTATLHIDYDKMAQAMSKAKLEVVIDPVAMAFNNKA